VTEEELDAEIREEDLMDEGEPALPEEGIAEHHMFVHKAFFNH